MATWALTATLNHPSTAAAQMFCAGECNGDAFVSSSEILMCAQIRDGSRPLADCPSCDCNQDGTVSAEEFMVVQRNALQGCANDCPPPTPTSTATANPLTPSSTPTMPEPTATTGPNATSTPVPPPTATASATGTISSEATPTVAPSSCLGDCDGDGRVLVNELVIGVNITLERAALGTCPIFDANSSTTVSVDELVRGVNNLLRGCL